MLCMERYDVQPGSDSNCESDDLASVIRKITFDTLHWLFEAHESDVIAKLLGSNTIELHATPGVTCFAVGYCVSHSNCTWKIDFKGCSIGDEGVEMLVRGAVEEETHCTGGISELELCFNITSEGVKHLLGLPKQLKNRLEMLR